MRLALNNSFKSPRVNFVFLNTLFLLTSLQLVYLKQDYFNIFPLIKQVLTNQAQILPITLETKNLRTTTFSLFGSITARSRSSKNILKPLNKLKWEEKIVPIVSSSRIFTGFESKGINFPTSKNTKAISNHFNLPNSPKDLLGTFEFDQQIIKNKAYQQKGFSIVENSLDSAKYNLPQIFRKINFSDESNFFNPYSSLIASWCEKVQHYEQLHSRAFLFATAFENTIKDLRFLQVLTSDKDLRIPASNLKNGPDVKLRELTAEFFWTLEGNVGLENGKKSAFNPGTGKFNQDITYELYAPVSDFFKTHRIVSCSPDDICDFIGTHS